MTDRDAGCPARRSAKEMAATRARPSFSDGYGPDAVLGDRAASMDPAPAVADAPAALLDEDDRIVRSEAAFGLSRRDDPRTGRAIERVGPLDPAFEHDRRAHGLREWSRWKKNATDEA
ncbi:hypothetical protein ACIO6T_06685 [Streptomyces sp. NPDC087532]|uniref:hypothetical protein n=1 Tax=Streptomyces sp. NPDC087532 TaxID=3365795 RepID=UPI0037FE2FFD